MNTVTLAQNAYKSSTDLSSSGKKSEYQIFARVTHRLIAAQDKANAHHNELLEAVHENLRLWGILAVDVADAGNGLPKELRASLFYLFEFTREHSRKIIAGTENADALIEINQMIMRGLAQTPATVS